MLDVKAMLARADAADALASHDGAFPLPVPRLADDVRALAARVAELEAAAKPVAAVAARHDGWPDDTYTETKYEGGEAAPDPSGPTVGDYRRLAALLATA